MTIRESVANALGGVESCRVFDAYAGPGEMHRAVWSRAALYVGCDRREFIDDRLAYVAENDRVLRAINLQKFNVFDLDSDGCPWDAAFVISSRRKLAPGEAIGLVLSDSFIRKPEMTVSPGLVALAGLTSAALRRGMDLAALRKRMDVVRDKALYGLAKRFGADIAQRWCTTVPGRQTNVFTGLALVGKGEAPA